MSRPILVLDGRNFQSGISMLGAHAERGGIFFKAAGVTPLFDAGSALSVNNGFLMAGAAGTAATYGSVTGNIIKMIPDGGVYYSGGLGLIGVTDDNEIVKIALADGIPSGSLSAVNTTTPAMTPGLVVFGISGAQTLIYRQISQIGKYVSSTYTDNYITSGINTDYFGAMHVHYGLNKIIYGNGPGKLGTIDSVGTSVTAALAFDTNSYCSALSDDGIYVIAALTRNSSADATLFNESKIIFWDGSRTTGFLRDFTITDPIIYSIQKTPIGIFAFGNTGIWQVTFDGVKKIFNHNPGVYLVTATAGIHYGNGATSFFSDALIWGGQVGSSTARAVKSLGKLDSAALGAYLNPILGTASKNITALSGQLSKGYVFIADDTPQLKYYPIGSGTPQTGVTAQTVYFSVPKPLNIERVDVIFGEPLASGDTLDLDVYRDEDTSAVSFGDVSYTAQKATRRHSFRNTSSTGGITSNLEVYQKFSLLLTFTAGTPKVARIEVFGSAI